MVNVIDTRNSVLNTFLSEIRAVDIQQDRMRFRRNLERVGEVMAYETVKRSIIVPGRSGLRSIRFR